MIKSDISRQNRDTDLYVPRTTPITETRPSIYLAKYHPLAEYPGGLEAIQKYRLSPFVDASCRREPDLESSYPSISTICHGVMFAPRLQPGDVVVYITSKGRYENLPVDHWRFTAVLKVIERFATHEEAAEWYQAKGLPLPSNCLVEGNKPLPLEVTCGFYCDDDDKERVPRNVAEWDERYQSRVEASSVFLVCKPLYIRLRNAPAINDNDVKLIFPNKKMPTARIPSVIAPETLQRILQMSGIRIAPEELEDVYNPIKPSQGASV
jgi:hypothetical protein